MNFEINKFSVDIFPGAVKNVVTGKIICHFLPTNFFAWLFQNIN